MTRLNAKIKQGVQVLSFVDSHHLNAPQVAGFADEMNELLRKPASSKFLLNFSGVEFIGSAMIGELMRTQKHCQDRFVDLRFCEISPAVLEVFKLLRLDEIWSIYDSEAEGIGAHQQA